MKPPLKKLTLLLTLLPALTLTVSAAHVVNTGTVTESGAQYGSEYPDQRVLRVTGVGTKYDGTNILLSSTSSGTFAGVYASGINTESGATATLHSSTIVQTVSGGLGA
ncbi:MAG: hypothetical protein LBK76_06580 [Verrucomicrobiales bacterium]|jgi:hypothetical protein|nr:hypothetical protein [Verrucomicrobiales bacterium]